MDDVAFLYNARFFARRHKLNWRIPIVCGAIYDVMGLEKEDTIADFGCAIGDLVQGFLDLGLTAHGFEGSDAVLRYVMCPKENFFIADLRKPINDKGFVAYDLITCFEVAEHIEKQYTDEFVTNLCSFSDQIVMSAAPPGQDGHGHVNCQPYSYWDKKFIDYGYKRETTKEKELKQRWDAWKHKPGVKAYWQNLLIYRRDYEL